MSTHIKAQQLKLMSYLIASAMLLIVLQFGLLTALLSGLLVFTLVCRFGSLQSRSRWSMLAHISIAIFILAILIALIASSVLLIQAEGGLGSLLGRLADILDSIRDKLPSWLATLIPQTADELKKSLTYWLRENAAMARLWSSHALEVAVQLLMGMIIGLLIALGRINNSRLNKFQSNKLALTQAINSNAMKISLRDTLKDRVKQLYLAFLDVVAAQITIATINTLFTAIYLLIILPLCGIHLPFGKTMVLVTFMTGLLPIIGNLVSNAIITLLSVTHSFELAITSIAFLISFH